MAATTLARLTLMFTFVVSSVPAQTAAPEATARPCGGIDNIGAPLNNPFTARRVHTTLDDSAAPKTPVLEPELVARDSSGRIRVEKRGVRNFAAGQKQETLRSRDGAEWTVSEEETGILVNLFDCSAGKTITIQPAMRMALIRELPARASSTADRPYSYFYTSLLRGKPNPAFLAEDLGDKDIEGVSAHGIRTTFFGTDDDEWKGKPTRITEMWVSDDLAAVVIDSGRDLKRGGASVIRLVDIKRVEPASGLFEIPSGFKINPIELPYHSEASGPTQPPGTRP